MSKSVLVIGMGSNIEPITSLRRALHLLKQCSAFKVLNVASIYESDALLPNGAPDEWNKNYLNSAVKVELTQTISFEDVLERLKEIEIFMGRNQGERWSPRVIDLDILWCDACWPNNFKSNQLELEIPHKELKSRLFALLPLLELMPNLIHDDKFATQYLQTEAFKNLLQQLKSNKQILFEKNNQLAFHTHISTTQTWPELVAILNITPDSFSDGGVYFSENRLNQEVLLQTVLHHTSNGVQIFDVGAESTRPQSQKLTIAEEYSRLDEALKVLQPLQDHHQIKISIDSRNPDVIEKISEEYSIDYINDVEGFQNKKMYELAQILKTQNIIMHSLSVPPKKELVLDENSSVFNQLEMWWNKKTQEILTYADSLNGFYFDLGIGFGKTARQSLELLENLEKFNIREPFYLGFSRKSFLKEKYDLGTTDKADIATGEIIQILNQAYCQQLRVHNTALAKNNLIYNLKISKLIETLQGLQL